MSNRYLKRIMLMLYVGIDPGKTGGIAAINGLGEIVAMANFDKSEKLGVVVMSFMQGLEDRVCGVALEKVHAMPGQGVTSMFNFGCGYGQIIGVLDCLAYDYLNPTPQAWHKVAGLGRKDIDSQVSTKELISDWVIKQVGFEPFILGRRSKPHSGLVDAVGIALWARDKLTNEAKEGKHTCA